MSTARQPLTTMYNGITSLEGHAWIYSAPMNKKQHSYCTLLKKTKLYYAGIYAGITSIQNMACDPKLSFLYN